MAWLVDTTRQPDSDAWRCVLNIERNEVVYALPAVDAKRSRLFLLVVWNLNENADEPEADLLEPVLLEISLLESHRNEEPRVRYFRDLGVFWELPWEMSTLGSSSNFADKLFLFDRTISQGDVPFWWIHLEADKVHFERAFVPSSPHECLRFSFLLSPDDRRAARVLATGILLIFNAPTWTEYTPAVGNEVSLHDVGLRAIGETISAEIHRVGAVASQFAILSCNDGGATLIRTVKWGRHTFYRLSIDETRREYSLAYYTCVQKSDEEDVSLAMYYAVPCSQDEEIRPHYGGGDLILVCTDRVGLVRANPPSLIEAARLSLGEGETTRLQEFIPRIPTLAAFL